MTVAQEPYLAAFYSLRKIFWEYTPLFHPLKGAKNFVDHKLVLAQREMKFWDICIKYVVAKESGGRGTGWGCAVQTFVSYVQLTRERTKIEIYFQENANTNETLNANICENINKEGTAKKIAK